MANDLAPIESALIQNDLSKLSQQERLGYYKSVCESLGLNPLTQPFEYLSFQGKLRLYAKRDATDQLRKVNSVSVSIVSREFQHDLFIVTARAVVGARSDESVGAVFVGGLKGDSLANAIMKAETKAKRRVTLSVCGLGILDESEIEAVKGAVTVTQEQVPQIENKPTTATESPHHPWPWKVPEADYNLLMKWMDRAQWSWKKLSDYLGVSVNAEMRNMSADSVMLSLGVLMSVVAQQLDLEWVKAGRHGENSLMEYLALSAEEAGEPREVQRWSRASLDKFPELVKRYMEMREIPQANGKATAAQA